jgi:hypothetical protein
MLAAWYERGHDEAGRLARVSDGVVDAVGEGVDANRVGERVWVYGAQPNGVDIFYLMLVATIVGFITVFHVRARTRERGNLRHWIAWVVAFALAAALALTLVVGPGLDRFHVPVLETWGILALHSLAVASLASATAALLGRWAILPVWLFFVVPGNSSSGGAVFAPLCCGRSST